MQGTLREPDFPLHKTPKNDISIKVLSSAKCHISPSAARLNFATCNRIAWNICNRFRAARKMLIGVGMPLSRCLCWSCPRLCSA